MSRCSKYFYEPSSNEMAMKMIEDYNKNHPNDKIDIDWMKLKNICPNNIVHTRMCLCPKYCKILRCVISELYRALWLYDSQAIKCVKYCIYGKILNFVHNKLKFINVLKMMITQYILICTNISQCCQICINITQYSPIYSNISKHNAI